MQNAWLSINGGYCSTTVRAFTSPLSQWVFLRRLHSVLWAPTVCPHEAVGLQNGHVPWARISIELESSVSSSCGLDFSVAQQSPEEAGLRRGWLCGLRK